MDAVTRTIYRKSPVPLLDQSVVEFAWSLPNRYHMRAGKGKWLMREHLSTNVPREMIERPIMGYSSSMASWLRGPLREWAQRLSSPEKLDRHGLIATAPIRHEWKAFQDCHSASQEALCGALIFQAWHDHWEGIA